MHMAYMHVHACTHVPIHVCQIYSGAGPWPCIVCIGHWNVLMGVEAGIFVSVLCLGLSEVCYPY